GMSYMNLDSITKGIKHLKLADSLYDEIGFILPSQKRLLSELSDYYAGIGDISTQLKYINKQIFLDSIYNKIYASINSRIIREYDTPRLIAQKEALIAQLEEEKSFLSKKSAWILAFLILSLGSIPFFVVRQRKLKKRFDTLIKSMDSEVKKIPKPVTKSSLSSEVIDEIMEKLQRFEDQQKYLSGSVSLQGVAKSFNTNSSYLSKVVNLHKDKNFSQYLNDLRIDYAINELTNNAKFRRYTIKAIAQDVGFGNSQSFSKAFHSKTGLQPSYFVRKLNKQAS
ncbi:MAG: helix-turn-helix domain-containing protein, partial [Gilvibacter sp.]